MRRWTNGIWFQPSGSQWVARMDTGAWSKLENSPLAEGWVYYDWAFAYGQDADAWYWLNDDLPWEVNMDDGAWGRFGIPAGMARIPAGTNAGSDPDYGAYSLTVDSFHIDKHEVTKALWDEVRAWGVVNGYGDLPAGEGKAADHPVQMVDWYDCVKWCNARSEMEGLSPVYQTFAFPFPLPYRTGENDSVLEFASANGYRLPSGTQWRYAARGGLVGKRFSWGDTIQHERANYFSAPGTAYDTSPTAGYHPTYAVGDGAYSSPVGSFAANGYGLYDTTGNVGEWCFDWHVEGDRRTVCDAGWHSLAVYCCLGYVYGFSPTQNKSYLGFRTARP
jgi:formylglycine-generating enzyme required for sulfatase activity